MKIVVSPAKSLNFESPLPIQNYTESLFLKDAETIQKTLKKKKPKQLMELMDISEKLADLNWERNQNWSLPFSPENARPAVFAFDGDVYTGLDAYSLSHDDLAFAQNHLRSLSGLYGLLRPLDLMMPYRLEMGTKLANERGSNLYQFWEDRITQLINDDLEQVDAKILLNIASDEYYKSVKEAKIQAEIIKPVFLDQKNGKYKVISFYAKKARGLMARYMIEHQIDQVDGIKSFNTDGYYFDAESSLKGELVFKRDEKVA